MKFRAAKDKKDAVERLGVYATGTPSSLGPGSKEHKNLLVDLARALGLEIDEDATKQELAKYISRAYGRSWLPEYESEGQTITLAGLNQLLEIASLNLAKGHPGVTSVVEAPRRSPNWSIEELLLAAELVVDNGGQQLDDSDVRVKELSKILNAAPFHDPKLVNDKFRSPSSVALKTANIAQHHPQNRGGESNGSKLDKIALDRFLETPEIAKAEVAAIREMLLDPHLRDALEYDESEYEISAAEGRVLRVWQVRRERNPALRKAKIESVVKRGGQIVCEVCHFNFGELYGPRGAGYIEVHHKLPLHYSGETETRFEDLALLCSNCHRMIHRSSWITVEELRNLIETQE
jgi:5-methylcytosine-specific restriction protein A